MKKLFKWEDVLEYLRQNPDKVFDYGTADTSVKSCTCLMSQFYKSKLGYDCISTFEGWDAIKSVDKSVRPAEIINPPFHNISEIHGGDGKTKQKGSEILKNYEKWTWTE